MPFPRDEMKKAYLHEIQHIEKKHFDQDISVTKAEGRNRRMIFKISKKKPAQKGRFSFY